MNGYKDGAVYTPAMITEYICKYTIEKAVIHNINNHFKWQCTSLDEIKFNISSLNVAKQVNEVINSIKICDPAVGSGHFLVSALNRIIAIKAQLGVLFKYGTNDQLSEVDINPKAVYICQLRLWIELLKNAYYKNGVMETLPNIDINIKTGNSLINRIKFDVGKKIGRGDMSLESSIKKLIKEYKEAVKQYKAIDDKKDKANVTKLIKNLKNAIQKKWIQISLFDNEEENINIYDSSFEWAFEIPEVLDENGKFIGFDIVIGNPPYIPLQEIHEESDKLKKQNYLTYTKKGDIYCLFYERGYQLLKKGGILSFITSNKWMRAGYGESLRKFFINNATPTTLIDFAGTKIFKNVTVDTNILCFQKSSPFTETQSCIVKEKCLNNLSVYIEQNSSITTFTNFDSWTILSPIEKSIKAKIEAVGVPLKNWDISINYGIKTGCNDAFIINGDKREELITIDPKSAEIIRPILRGRDIKRYGYTFADLWVILAKFGSYEYLETKYPAIYSHLIQYKVQLENRGQCRYTSSGKINTDKPYPGQHHWLELDNNPRNKYLEK